eukprot:330563_1
MATEGKECTTDTEYCILWHWDDSFRRYDTDSEARANKKWLEINKKASRIMIHNKKCINSWFCNDDWKSKIMKFAEREKVFRFEFIVVWHWNKKWEIKYCESMDEANKIYSTIPNGATRILTNGDTIPKASYHNKDWKKKILLKWIEIS